ncbi:anthranilate synthase component I family protein [Sphingomonas turrisvirgatae]|uniref:Anthranilate synthase component I n=1 Tax=Sphingomonas turrisvirgatae TaxID=1888892 RepID=A0A1E3LQR8_9SPHN|nr:chorismate-binding protein [Sphingomonas turrisvirgatae]ODP36107.1 anthranilate synthase component I [Sphingomonas turrisvirgatae]
MGHAGDVQGAEAARAALAQGRPALVWRRELADTDTPVGAALKLIEPGRGDFLLESVEGGAVRGRHSLIGLAPDLVFRAHGEAAEINRHWLTDRAAFEPAGAPTLQAMRELVQACRMDVPAELPRALACLVGYFGYETIGLVEKLPRAANDVLGVPDMIFVRPTVVLIFDRLTDALFVVAPVWPDATQDADALIAAAAERIDATAARLATAPLPPRATSDVLAIEPTPALDPADYAAMVGRAKDYIAAGDIFQVVLAQRFSAPFPLPPIELYRALRRVNPSPFLYFLDLPGFALTGSSPEILVRVRDGEVTIRPIAGTRPRGKTADEDAANKASLLADAKERAEHLMLLDLGRNDTGRVAAAGSVKVTDSYTVEFYSHVMHIVSNVVGRLRPDADALDALFAGFPAGTVSGAPKVRACEIIAELERDARGPYAGGVGYFSPDGSMDSCIVLRTGIVKDGTLHVSAGAGIVADSDPAYEQRECEAKAGALFAAAREAVARASTPRFGQ